MMYCKNCGKQIKDRWVFCKHCGYKLTSSKAYVNNDFYMAPMKKNKGVRKKIIVMLSGIAFILLIVGIFLVVKMKGNIEKADEPIQWMSLQGAFEQKIYTYGGSKSINIYNSDMKLIDQYVTDNDDQISTAIVTETAIYLSTMPEERGEKGIVYRYDLNTDDVEAVYRAQDRYVVLKGIADSKLYGELRINNDKGFFDSFIAIDLENGHCETLKLPGEYLYDVGSDFLVTSDIERSVINPKYFYVSDLNGGNIELLTNHGGFLYVENDMIFYNEYHDITDSIFSIYEYNTRNKENDMICQDSPLYEFHFYKNNTDKALGFMYTSDGFEHSLVIQNIKNQEITTIAGDVAVEFGTIPEIECLGAEYYITKDCTVYQIDESGNMNICGSFTLGQSEYPWGFFMLPDGRLCSPIYNIDLDQTHLVVIH